MEPFIKVTDEEKREYMELKTEISRLEARSDELGGKILAELVSTGVEVVESDLGTISIANKKKWTMPAQVVALKEQLKEQEELAKKVGTAEYELVPYMTFRANKN